jgi:dTMP kinase
MTDHHVSANFPMGKRYGEHPYDGEYPGKLIIVEGIDGSGKSTQIDLLGKWLNSLGFVTIFTEWNSSPIVRRTTKRGKDERMLTPMSFSLIHAADFANRVYTQVLPALKSGTIVLADRYVYTAFARDAARGVNRDWLRRIYSFAVTPSLALYFKVPLEESISRIVAGREEIGFYESGQDMGFSGSRADSFRTFQGRLLDEYDSLTEEYGLVTIDATRPISAQQQLVRQYVEPLLPGAMKIHGQDVHEALTTSGLTGRYIRHETPSRQLEPTSAPDI